MTSARMLARRIRRRHLGLLVAALAALVTGAAACHRRSLDEIHSNDPAILVFRNEALEQAAVYAVSGNRNAQRIGTVMSGRTDTLTVPADMTLGGSVVIFARLLARSMQPSTGSVSILPGEWYQVTLPPDARLLAIVPIRE